MDGALQAGIHEYLEKQYPSIGFLGEETAPDIQQQVIAQADLYWCLDPLDGTSNFVNHIPFWAVSLALVCAKQIEFAIIIDPLRKECFSAIRGSGAWCNGEKLICNSAVLQLNECIAAVDFKRLAPALARHVVSNPCYRSQRNFGSCALEWCWLAANRIQLYLHGGMKFWDYAAGSLILSEAGGYAATLEGEPVMAPEYPKRSVVAAVNEELYKKWARKIGLH